MAATDEDTATHSNHAVEQHRPQALPSIEGLHRASDVHSYALRPLVNRTSPSAQSRMPIDLIKKAPIPEDVPKDFPTGLYALAFTVEQEPPADDNSRDDAETAPQKQFLRTSSNLYAPRWTRGRGASRQAWCGLCQQGQWLDLRCSEDWYDKLYKHGIDSDGDLLPRPEGIRKTSNGKGWECLCGICDRWISLRRAEATWFRHVYDVSTLRM